MPLNLIIILAALIISWLVFTWLLKVVKTTVTTAIAIAAIVLILQLMFGIKPDQLWSEIINLSQTLWNLIPHG